MNNKKYKIRKDIVITKFGKTLYRIQANRNIGSLVKKGDLGGYIESYKNLSQNGSCWIVGEQSYVYGSSNVSGDAKIIDSNIYNNCKISGKVSISKSTVSGNCIIKGDGLGEIHNSSLVNGVKVSGSFLIKNTCLENLTEIKGHSIQLIGRNYQSSIIVSESFLSSNESSLIIRGEVISIERSTITDSSIYSESSIVDSKVNKSRIKGDNIVESEVKESTISDSDSFSSTITYATLSSKSWIKNCKISRCSIQVPLRIMGTKIYSNEDYFFFSIGINNSVKNLTYTIRDRRWYMNYFLGEDNFRGTYKELMNHLKKTYKKEDIRILDGIINQFIK